ncbi:putative oxidoreductase [Bradyrhizobium japonicum]
MAEETDVIVVGAGLSGLVAATEIADAGKRVIVVDQEGEQSLGGQAWSFGGLFLVNSPEQRRLGIKDSFDLAMQDWLGTAGFDRDEDFWPRQWAEAYVAFAAGEKRDWLRAMGHRIFPVVGWAERGGYDAMGHGNSVPRFHVTWGTGPGIVEPFERRAREAMKSGRLTSGSAIASTRSPSPTARWTASAAPCSPLTMSSVARARRATWSASSRWRRRP